MDQLDESALDGPVLLFEALAGSNIQRLTFQFLLQLPSPTKALHLFIGRGNMGGGGSRVDQTIILIIWIIIII